MDAEGKPHSPHHTAAQGQSDAQHLTRIWYEPISEKDEGMADVLLTVSGCVASPEVIARIARGTARRIDYLEMARAFEADLIDFAAAQRAGPISRFIARFLDDHLALAWACFRQREAYQVIFADCETVGLPLAAMLKYLAPLARSQPQLLVLGHDVLAAKKRPFYDLLRVHTRISYHLVFNQTHKHELQRRWGIPEERIVITHCMADPHYFNPEAVVPRRRERPQICAVGIEARDYGTLVQAVRGLAVDVVIAAASPWSRQIDPSRDLAPPPNVIIDRDLTLDVRQLYADSAFVVMPLFDVDRAAGSTTILEAMAMGKAVICSRALGQRELVVEGETGLYVPTGDVAALRTAIQYLLDHPAEAARMGAAGRRRVEQELSLDHYVELTASYVRRCLAPDQDAPLPTNSAPAD